MENSKIEERAKEYTHRYVVPFLSGFETAEYEAYKAGATEQKAIDDAELTEVKKQRDEYYDELLKLRQQKAISIDKACEWLNENARQLMSAELRQQFKKAMEE